MVQRPPQLFSLLQAEGVYPVLVQVHKFPVPVHHVPVDDGGAAVAPLHAEEHVPVDVVRREGGEGLVVHDDDVGGGPGPEHPQGLFEVPGADGRVVAEEHPHGLPPPRVGPAEVVPLHGQEDLQALQHVVGVGVGAQAHQDALLAHPDHRGAAHGVVHVGLRVVAHHGARLPDDVQLRRGEVDAVAQQGLFPQNAVVEQPVHRPAAVIAQGVVHVVHALGHVDVEAGAAAVGLHHLLKGLIRNSEQGVAAEHGADHVVVPLQGPGEEVGVLLNGLAALVRPVPLADLVAQAGPDARLFAHVFDGEEGAGDLPIGGVVVKDGGHPVPDAVQHGGPGAGPGAVQGQAPVDVPPLPVQNFIEVRGAEPVDGQAPGQTGVDMGVDVDEPGHDDPAPCVHKFRLGVPGPQGGEVPHFPDSLPLQDHRPVFPIGRGVVPGDKPSVSHQQHGRASFPV